MTVKEQIEKSIALTIISISIASFLAGIGTFKGILEIAKLEIISTAELKLKENELNVLKIRIKEDEIKREASTKSVIVGKNNEGILAPDGAGISCFLLKEKARY